MKNIISLIKDKKAVRIGAAVVLCIFMVSKLYGYNQVIKAKERIIYEKEQVLQEVQKLEYSKMKVITEYTRMNQEKEKRASEIKRTLAELKKELQDNNVEREKNTQTIKLLQNEVAGLFIHKVEAAHIEESHNNVYEKKKIVQKPHEERKLPLKKGVGNNIQNLVAHAYKTADNDKGFWEEVKSTKYTQLQPMDFVLTLDSENGTWNKNRMSMIVGANGYRDQGICQLNRKYHIKFINSPEFQNEYKQVDYCWEVWKKGVLKNRLETTFYGYNTRDRNRKNFSF